MRSSSSRQPKRVRWSAQLQLDSAQVRADYNAHPAEYQATGEVWRKPGRWFAMPFAHNAFFTGRETELARLHTSVQQG